MTNIDHRQLSYHYQDESTDEISDEQAQNNREWFRDRYDEAKEKEESDLYGLEDPELEED